MTHGIVCVKCGLHYTGLHYTGLRIGVVSRSGRAARTAEREGRAFLLLLVRTGCCLKHAPPRKRSHILRLPRRAGVLGSAACVARPRAVQRGSPPWRPAEAPLQRVTAVPTRARAPRRPARRPRRRGRCTPRCWLQHLAPLTRTRRVCDAGAASLASPATHAMLRAGHAPVASRGPRLGGPSAARYGVNATAAAARSSLAPPPLPQLGFRGHPPRRGSLSAAAPSPAFRARRGSFPYAPLHARSSGERASEVRPTPCFACCLCTQLTSLSSQPSQAAPIEVWVKRMDKAGARYDFVKSVDPEQNVAEFIARWVSQEELDVRPSLVTLRLVPCGARTPTAEEEQAAAELDPRVTLADAGFTDGCSLLAVVAGALDAAGPRVSRLMRCLRFPSQRRSPSWMLLPWSRG